MKIKFLLSGYFLLLTLVVYCPRYKRFEVVTLSPNLELNGKGKNIDSIAFWEAPDASRTLMFVTAKGNSLVEVWEYPFVKNEREPIVHPTFTNSQVNGVWVDQVTHLLYISVAHPSSTVSVFHLPELDFVMNFNKEGVDLKSEPNLALLKLKNGTKRLYVSADNVVYLHEADTGKYLGEFRPKKGLETMVADDFYQVLYIPDENDRTGIYAYNPDGSPFFKNGINQFGNSSIMDEDGEGIVLYTYSDNGKDAGEGFIVVADQREDRTDFEVFDRKSWEHMGAFRIEGVSNTDGIASTQKALPEYPKGLFAAINDDSSVVCVGWDRILEAVGR